MINSKYANLFCCEDISLIENYDKAIGDAETWDCHHRLETHDENGNLRQIQDRLSREDLKHKGLYFNRPAKELVFLSRFDHRSLHWKGVKRGHPSEEHRKKMSEVRKGKKLPPRSEDWRRRLSESLKGHSVSDEQKRKHREQMRGRHWYNNGTTSTLAHECPEGFVLGRLNF